MKKRKKETWKSEIICVYYLIGCLRSQQHCPPTCLYESLIICRVLPLREDLCRDRALMAANDYRVYLRNHIDMEEAPGRAAHTGSTHRALIFGTLAVMGVLQVASSVAILLHLTGYLREVRNSQGSKDRRNAQSPLFHKLFYCNTLQALSQFRCMHLKVLLAFQHFWGLVSFNLLWILNVKRCRTVQRVWDARVWTSEGERARRSVLCPLGAFCAKWAFNVTSTNNWFYALQAARLYLT